MSALGAPPVAADDAFAGDEDEIITGNVLGNDSDVDDDPLTALLVADVANGTLALNADGSFTYTPAANFFGSDSFTYRANDGSADSNLATVTLTVRPVNDAPVAVDDAFDGTEDEVITGNVLDNDSDIEGDVLTAVLVDDVANGTLVLGADGSFAYTPNADFNGSDSFTYRANDGTEDGNLATVTLTVEPENDAPVAVDDDFSGDEDSVITGNVLANDSDVDGDALTAMLIGDVAHGTLDLNADGSFTYTPHADYNGTDSFTYKANDGTLDSAVATVSLAILPVNDAPTLASVADRSAAEGELVQLQLVGSDVDGDPLTYSLVSGPGSLDGSTGVYR